MVRTLSAQEQPISKIFGSDYVFNIPSYQRPYAWTMDHARDLLDDLVTFMESSSGSVANMPPYFLGSIVLIKEDGRTEADVVDGQQRLTTLTILLSVIRGNLTNHREGITRLLYEQGDPILGSTDRYRLYLRSWDRDFFQKYIQREDGLPKLLSMGGGLTGSQLRIQENAIYFHTRIKEMTDDQRLALAQFIVTRCFLVTVSTPDMDSAYRIFSVLNSRGLDLTATDILKADIIGKIAEAERDEYTEKWETAERELDRDGFQELFSHIRMIYRKAKPQGTLLKEFRDHVCRKYEPLKLVDDVLLPYVSAYMEVSRGEYVAVRSAEQVNESLGWLDKLEFTDWVPPALAFTIRNRAFPEKMDQFFKDLERLAYSLLITKTWANGRIERFSNLTRDIESGSNLYAMNSPLQLTAQEQFDVYKVLSGAFYESLSARARSTVLVRLDALLNGGGARYDHAVITVEHVLPQNPKAESTWLQWFPESAKRSELVHCLGNLALLTRKKNSAASNYEFATKKAAYFTRNGVTPFPLTTQVLGHQEWRPAIIEARQRQLLATLETHWRLGGRQGKH
ncbi:MAG: DUF262 domain-containing protein [Magnetospirillum sp.]|nr:DUF262 domain-containing protein [Magnetospirillum sp.]